MAKLPSTPSLRRSPDAIGANDYDLSILRYVAIAKEETKLDLAKKLPEVREVEQERSGAEWRMNALFAELGFAV